MNDLMPVTHLFYILLGVSLTIGVARTLRSHGSVFLIKGCKGNHELADSLSHLLSVGFYLLHVGIVLLTIRIGGEASGLVDAIELLSTKTGMVLVVLAVSHFAYLALYSRIHGKPKLESSDSHSTAVLADPLA